MHKLTIIFNRISCKSGAIGKEKNMKFTNFRPIFILCNFIVTSIKILKIKFHQHGFMKGRSTTSNLMTITQFISESMNRQLQTDVAYTDVAKLSAISSSNSRIII